MTLASSWPSIAGVLVLLVSVPAVANLAMPRIGMPGCNTTCGNVSVPYPFGMGPSRCYYSPGFKLTCDQHGPPRLLLGDGRSGKFEVVDISLKNTTMRVVTNGVHSVNMSGGGSVRWSLGDTLGSLPYFVKPGDNEFILVGCGVQATLQMNGSLVSGCASFCPHPYMYVIGPVGSPCTNIGCCETPIFTGSASYVVELKQLDDQSLPAEPNILVIIAELGWLGSTSSGENTIDVVLDFNVYKTDLVSRRTADHLRVPVILQWTVAHDVYAGVGNHTVAGSSSSCPEDAGRSICKSTNTKCIDETSSTHGDFFISPELGGYSCQCKKGYQGNPYLTAGCQDIKECDRKENHGCFGDCEELPGSFRCRCPKGTHGNYTVPGACVKTADTGHPHLALIIGLSVASGPCILILVLGTLLLTHELKQRKAKSLRRKFFTQNRGQLLKQLVSHRADIAERMLISLVELEKATNNFDLARRLGRGGHGTVYKGILSDLHVVAIKKSNIVVKREIDEFINEVDILSQINHRNIVKLRGCCLETEVPLLAYEFISNGSSHKRNQITTLEREVKDRK